MGRKTRNEPTSTPPKLSYYSLPAKRPDPPGMATPPLRLPGAVPFLWEEAPGKPRRELGLGTGSGAAKCLELPPRMAVVAPEEVKDGKQPSPTTVLDGPYELNKYASISTCYSFSFGDERMCRVGNKVQRHGERRVWFWRKVRKGRRGGKWEIRDVGRVEEASPTLSSSISSVSSCGDGGGDGKKAPTVEEEEKVKAKIMRIRRSRSLSSVSHYATSHLWAGIKGGLKQVVPWMRP